MFGNHSAVFVSEFGNNDFSTRCVGFREKNINIIYIYNKIRRGQDTGERVSQKKKKNVVRRRRSAPRNGRARVPHPSRYASPAGAANVTSRSDGGGERYVRSTFGLLV